MTQSSILPCSPNCLPIESKANSTLELLTSSPLVVNVWLSTEPFHLLSLSRQEYHKAVFKAPYYSESSSVISLTLENPLYLFVDDIPHPSDRQTAASSLSSHLAKITNLSNTTLLMYPYCPHFAFSLTPHRDLHSLFVGLRLLSHTLLLFLLSPAVPFVMLCPDLFCVIALPQAETMLK